MEGLKLERSKGLMSLKREKMNNLNRWFGNLLVQRLITLIEFEEDEFFKQIYNSSLDRIVSQITKER
ncbi:hypothetical protein E0698_19505 [Paenibacillus sp. 23TSA30-6]|nr:hypothetical protein [Paenibacillus sp. 23TSA30-6]